MTQEQERALMAKRANADQTGDDPKLTRTYGDNESTHNWSVSLDALKGMMIYRQQMASRKVKGEEGAGIRDAKCFVCPAA